MNKFPESFSVTVNNEVEFNVAHHLLMKLDFKPSQYGSENFYKHTTSTIRYTPSNGYIWGSSMRASNHFNNIGELVAFLLEPRLTERQKRIEALKVELEKLEAEEAAQ